jgi:hypothetical protein
MNMFRLDYVFDVFNVWDNVMNAAGATSNEHGLVR